MKRIEIELRMSEIRQTLNGDSPGDEAAVGKLQRELADLEGKLREALKAEDRAEAEKAAEIAPLTERIECRNYLQAAMTDNAVTGAERELQQELKLQDNAMPLEALDPGIRAEDRQDVATGVPAAAIGHPRQSLLRRIFRRTDAAWLGVQMPSVAPGEPVYPVMSAGTTGEMLSAGGEVDAAAATFTGHTVSPTRGTARYLYRVEDAAKFGGLEETLRADLREVMGQLLDDQVVSGSGVSPNLSGFIVNAAARSGNAPSAVANIASFDTSLADGIDGLYAYGPAGVRHFIGVGTQQFLMKTRITTGETPTIGELWGANGAVWRASARVAAQDGTTNIQEAYRFRPAEFRAVAPIWQGISLVRDPFSGAAKGEVAITAIMLFGYQELRGSAQTVDFKLAA